MSYDLQFQFFDKSAIFPQPPLGGHSVLVESIFILDYHRFVCPPGEGVVPGSRDSHTDENIPTIEVSSDQVLQFGREIHEFELGELSRQKRRGKEWMDGR